MDISLGMLQYLMLRGMLLTVGPSSFWRKMLQISNKSFEESVLYSAIICWGNRDRGLKRLNNRLRPVLFWGQLGDNEEKNQFLMKSKKK